MDINFPLILTWAVLISGAIVLFDLIFLASARRKQREKRRNEIDVTKLNKKQQKVAMKALVKEPVIVEYAYAFFPILLVVFVLRSFLIEPFQIPSGSMLPTLEVGDFILVNKYTYGVRLPVIDYKIIDVGEPKRGDVMVFKFPEDPSKNYIKRVIGLPGDRIKYENKTVYINHEKISQDYLPDAEHPPGIKIFNEKLDEVAHKIQVIDEKILRENGYDINSDTSEGEWVIDEGHYFVMGDNRDNSNDSRFWGFVPEKNIVGKATYVWMHWESWGSLPSFSRNQAIE